MRLDPRRLAVLGAVANAGGVLAAAAALHLTPSAVSQHIARLEAETGVLLLDRSQLGGRRSARLTPAGALLAAHATRLAETLAEAERELAALTGQATGPVGVGAFPTAIRQLVAPAVAEVAAGTPAVDVRIDQVERAPGLVALLAGGLDLLLVEADPAEPPVTAPGLRAVRLVDDPYQIVFPRRWAAGPVRPGRQGPQAHSSPPAGMEALLRRPWVDGPPGSTARAAVDRIAAAYDVPLHRPHACLEFPASLAIVSAGLAAAVVPALALPAVDPAAVEVLADPAAGARRIDLVSRRGRNEPGAAAELVARAIAARAR
jgi:DNA-binding transcriptional LysR family regulator